jgi:hypothetical protein
LSWKATSRIPAPVYRDTVETGKTLARLFLDAAPWDRAGVAMPAHASLGTRLRAQRRAGDAARVVALPFL